MSLRSCLYEGRVRHQRFGDQRNEFEFPLFMVYLDRKSDHASHVALLTGISAMMAVISAMVVSIQVTVFEPMVREIYRLKEEIEDLKSKSLEPSEQS